MNRRQVDELVPSLLEQAKRGLASSRFEPLVILADPLDKRPRTFKVDPRLVASDDGKDKVASLVKAQIALQGVTTVISVFDATSHAVPAEDLERVEALRSQGLTSRQIAQDYGIGTVRDVLQVAVDTTAGDGYTVAVPYSRVDGRVSFAEPERRSTVGGRMFFGVKA